MFIFDNRAKNILKYLLAHSCPVPAKQISNDLQLSPRQVRYSLFQVDAWLKVRGFYIEKKPGVGIQILCSSMQKHVLEEELDTIKIQSSFLSPHSRFIFILLNLFFIDVPITIKKLSYELSTSKSTIIRDLKKVKHWLSLKEITLVSKPNYGLKIEGKEAAIRSAFAQLLLNSIGEEDLLNMIFQDEDDQKIIGKINQKYTSVAGEFFANFNIKNVLYLSKLFNREIGKGISDNICLKLAIISNTSIYRINHGFLMNAENPEKKQSDLLRIASYIMEEYTQIDDQEILKKEISFLAHQLGEFTDKWHLNQVIPGKAKSNINIPIQMMTKEILEISSRKLHPSLLANRKLKNNIMSIFLEDTIETDLRINLDKGLHGRITARYPLVYETAEEIRDEVSSKFHFKMPKMAVDNLSICLIASIQELQGRQDPIRVLIVCNTGSITAWLIESRIRSEIPYLEVAGRSSVLDLTSRQDLSNIDLIITTITLEGITTPQIKVDPLLGSNDVQNIHNFITDFANPQNNIVKITKGKSGVVELKHLLTARTIKVKQLAKNWQEAVEIAGYPLVDIGVIDKSFIDAMKKVICKNGPYMVLWPGIALLHAHSTCGVKTLGMSLTTYSKPVFFGHEKNDPVDISLVIAATDISLQYHVLEQLLEVINNPESLNVIRHANEVNEIIELLQNI